MPPKDQAQQKSNAKHGQDCFSWFLANFLFDPFLERAGTFSAIAQSLFGLTSISVRCSARGRFEIVSRAVHLCFTAFDFDRRIPALVPIVDFSSAAGVLPI
jgi:hypothetical protein